LNFAAARQSDDDSDFPWRAREKIRTQNLTEVKDSNKVALIIGITGQDARFWPNCFWKRVTRCTASCGAPATYRDRASNIFGAMTRFMNAANFSITAIIPTAQL
jgi:hypothetical protein